MQQRVRDHHDAVGCDAADLDEQAVAAGRAVHDHAVAAPVQLGPERRRVARAARQHVVSREYRGAGAAPRGAQRPQVERGQRSPLPVHDIGPPAAHAAHEAAEAGHVTSELERDARARGRPSLEQAGQRRAEELAPGVAVRGGCRTVREVRGQELDLRTGRGQCSAELVVVGGRVGLGVDDDDAHVSRRRPGARDARTPACPGRRAPCRRARSPARQVGPGAAGGRGTPRAARR